MKPIILIFLIGLSRISGAQSKTDIFNKDVPLVFFGADFTHCQFTKSDEFINKPEILRFFVDVNNLFNSTYKKIMSWKLDHDSIIFDFQSVTRNNAGVKWEKVYSDNVDYIIPDDTIKIMIKNLKINQEKYKDYIGYFLCEENYCKTNKRAHIAVAFFRVNDLEPLIIKHLEEKPDGFGFLNYWGNPNYYASYEIPKLKKELK